MKKMGNRPRWLVLLVGIALIAVGFVFFIGAYQVFNEGSVFSSIPSPGYENAFLSYSEVAIIGVLITGPGILLVLASFGVRKWRKYQPSEFYINDVRTVGISVASSDYEKDRSAIKSVMQSAEVMVHSKDEFSIDDEAEHAMGWNFFVLHVTPALLQRIADTMEGAAAASGATTQRSPKKEDSFIEWLGGKLKEKQCNVYLDLESRKASSKYGLF